MADQLPMLVRGIYYEAWHPAGKPEKIRSRDEFLSRISAHFSRTRPINAEHAARAVFQVLQDHVSAGEIREVMGNCRTRFACSGPSRGKPGIETPPSTRSSASMRRDGNAFATCGEGNGQAD